MKTVEITVPEGEQYSEWVDLRAGFASLFKTWRFQTALSRLFVPESFDQATITLEFSETGEEATTVDCALYDKDGNIASEITYGGINVKLSPADFSWVSFARIKLPANASESFTFGVGVRRV